MIRRFFWVYLIVIVPTTLSILMLKYSIDYFEHSAFEESVRTRDKGRLAKLQQFLNQVPRDEWAEKIEELAKVYPVKLALTRYNPRDWQSLSESEKIALDSGKVALDWPDFSDQITVAQRLPQSDLVISTIGLVSGTSQWWTFAMIVLLPSLVAAGMLFVWFRPFWHDVKEIASVADDIGAGNFDVKAHVSRHSTLAVAGDAINHMADEIRQLLQNSSDLSLAVAHDLKTPITQLSLAVALLKSERDPAVRTQAEGMSGDLAELDASINEMLSAAQLERVAPFFPEHLDLKEFLVEIVESVQIETAGLASTSASVQLGPTASGRAYFDPRQMRRAVLNLVRNALRHAQTVVHVSGFTEASVATIIVDDDGPGIPLNQRERMFEPFMRGEATRQSSSNGYGLGLAIVQRIARLHGGIAQIHDAPSGGARILIRW